MADLGKADHYLLMGPWSHAGTRTPERELGGLTFGENSQTVQLIRIGQNELKLAETGVSSYRCG